MDRPKAKHKFIVEKVSNHQLHVYTQSDNVCTKILNRFKGLGEYTVGTGYDVLFVNHCFDTDEVKEYLESTVV